MDFYTIVKKSTKDGYEVYPDFKVVRSKDLMIRGKSFYAIWDSEKGLWSTDEYDVQRMIDAELKKVRSELGPAAVTKYMGNFASGSWKQFRSYLQNVSDSYVELDNSITFANTEVKKEDYVSRRLPYPLQSGDHKAWDELIGGLYDPSEKAKLEWAIGSVVAGDAKDIQKFLVLYGSAGTGKSTVLNIIQRLFTGYYTSFDAKALTGSSNSFSTEVFRGNPLVAIQHDGDLSRIEDNTKLNSIVSHEEIIINEKFKPGYVAKVNAFLFMGTNKPVKITDAKSGIIRRLIDVRPSGNLLPPKKWQVLNSQIDFELGAIAQHCLERYREMGRDYYSNYRPIEMMLETDPFYNFIEAHFDVFKYDNGVTLQRAFDLYKVYCDESNLAYPLSKPRFREELRNYFREFHERYQVNGERVRSYYYKFDTGKFSLPAPEEHPNSLVLDRTDSLLDQVLSECQAQKAVWSEVSQSEIPEKPWTEVETTLGSITTSDVHYVRPPINHIVIDFDLVGSDGRKSLERNMEAASLWPPTYAELSKSGSGVHLHYNYDGAVESLSRLYSDGIEIKVFAGYASLRRKLTRCNNVPIAILSGGLPLKEKKMIDFDGVKSEKTLRDLIERNLRKEIHPGTKPSIDFIHKILEDAHKSSLSYDVSNMMPKILAFANNSTHQSMYCVKLVTQMKFQSDDTREAMVEEPSTYDDDREVVFDVEVFPNLFVICWKYRGDSTSVRMINPTPTEVQGLLKLKLIGYNNRRYDNHILYAAYLGYSNEQLYELSKKLINNNRNAYFREAYEVSYADAYDYFSIKKSLKRWEIDLGIRHVELGLDWNQPVPEDLWAKVADYCVNDIEALDAVIEYRKQDLIARQILAELSGLSVNSTTQNHAARIIFGKDKDYKDEFVYTDLSDEFPGYKFELGKSSYMDEDPSEGGYVYAEPGMYSDVGALDVESMHPSSIIQLNLFGKYTDRFAELLNARLAIKHGDFELAGGMFNGALKPYLSDPAQAKDLGYALKIVINIVYGLTSAKFDNPFKDNRNVDNIVAKRGALFMIDLKRAVQAKGWKVVHIKTDSIKVPNITDEIANFIEKFGETYGYRFELESSFQKFCLVNDAVYVAKTASGADSHWSAVGAQFQHPYVFKTLFSKEEITLDDLSETKQVTTALYLDFETEKPMSESDEHLVFVGKVGSFTPIKEGRGGGILYREKDGKMYSATGAKGYFWMETERVRQLNKEKDIDMTYFEGLVNDAIENISRFGDPKWLME